MCKNRTRKLIGIASLTVSIFVVMIVSFAIFNRFEELIEDPRQLRDFIAVYRTWGYLVYGAMNVVQVLFAPIPGLVLTVSSGIIFGMFRGIIVSWLSVMIGGYGAMLIARHFGRRIMYNILDENAKRFESQISNKGLPLIFLLSLIPNPVGDGLFYLAGLTDVPCRVLILVIASARLPGIAISVFLGNKLLEFDTSIRLISGFGFLLIVAAYFIFVKKLEALFARIMNRTYPDWRS